MKKISRRAFAACALAAAALPALAADAFPARPIRIVVNTAPGGLTDVITRLVAKHMGDNLGQTVIVDDRAGGDGLIGIRAVKSAPADGYTLLASAGTLAFQTVLKQEPGYDLLKDFTGIGLMGRSPFLYVVSPASPDKTLGELVARAKANPGKLDYASAGVGTAPHLAMERFEQQSRINLLHVPYKGNGAAMPDVIAGRVNGIFEAYGSSVGKIKAGQLRALGVTSAKRLPFLPDVPTFQEQGFPGYTYYTWLCIVAPAGTPKPVVERLAQALQAATSSQAVKDIYRDYGVEAMNLTPEESNHFMAQEIADVSRLANDLHLPKN